MRSISDGIQEAVSYASSYVYCDADGNIHLQKGALASSLSFTSGVNVLQAAHQYNDENTRNVAKVWGFKGNVILRPNESPFIISENSVDLGLPVNKTTIYASNYIQTQIEADRLSSEIISSLGKFDSIKTVEVLGSPNIKIGYSASINIDLETSVIQGTSSITGVASDLSKDGYTMQVTLDEFCPHFGVS